MWKTITDAISNVTHVAIALIGLSVALEVVFGSNVPFLSLGVINNISAIVSDLGSQGLIGLITIGILWAIWKKQFLRALNIQKRGHCVPFFLA